MNIKNIEYIKNIVNKSIINILCIRKKNQYKPIKFSIVFFIIFIIPNFVYSARLKDIANVRGVRSNQLVGYGLVVGLKGTGDSKVEFTNKSMFRMLNRLGMKVSSPDINSKNVAGVILTAKLPPFARAGNKIDVTINSIGDAKSLKGGTLVQTPLRAANEEVYAVAQGPILIGEGGQNHTTVGRIPNGAIIEKDLAEDFTNRKIFRITLNNPDFTTSARVAKTLNKDLGGRYASAKDAATIDIVVPFNYEGKGVELLASIERLEIFPDNIAKVVINEKTGTVIIGEKVKISQIAISHGDLVVKVANQEKKETNNNRKAKQEKLILLEGSASVGELVGSMNRLGVSPKELIHILQSIKAAGALHGDLEIL